MFINWLKYAFFYSGLQKCRLVCRNRVSNPRLFVLYYHKINGNARPFFGRSVVPDVFEKQIVYLKRNFNVIDFSRLQSISHCENAPKDFVIVTFDDGYQDNYLYAFPILKKHGVPATIFLTTGFIGTTNMLWHDRLAWILYNANGGNFKSFNGLNQNLVDEINAFAAGSLNEKIKTLFRLSDILKKYDESRRTETLAKLEVHLNVTKRPNENIHPMLSWQQVREMAAAGISFGSHTVNHPVLTQLSTDQALMEIVESKQKIEENIGCAVKVFAYPYGKNTDISLEIVRLIKNCGYKYACSTIKGAETLPLNDGYRIKRKPLSTMPYVIL